MFQKNSRYSLKHHSGSARPSKLFIYPAYLPTIRLEGTPITLPITSIECSMLYIDEEEFRL